LLVCLSKFLITHFTYFEIKAKALRIQSAIHSEAVIGKQQILVLMSNKLKYVNIKLFSLYNLSGF